MKLFTSILISLFALSAWAQNSDQTEDFTLLNQAQGKPAVEEGVFDEEPPTSSSVEADEDVTSGLEESLDDEVAEEIEEEPEFKPRRRGETVGEESLDEDTVEVEPGEFAPSAAEQALQDVRDSQIESGKLFDLKKVRSQNPNETQKVKHPLAEKGLKKITKDNLYIYETKKSKKEHSSTLFFSSFEPTEFTGNSEDLDTEYSDIYDSSIMITIDYEWPMWVTPLGEFGVKVGSGFLVTRGNGVFARDGSASAEELTLIMFPNTASAIWRFRWTDDQLFVPYVEGGGGYYGLVEFQEDSNQFKFGGAPTVFGAGGIGLNLGRINRQAVLTMDRDYGVNNVLVNLEFRLVEGFQPFNLSYNSISFGFTFEY